MIPPRLTLLDDDAIARVLDEARQLLDDPGVRVHSDRALDLLDGAGARIDRAGCIARIPADLVDRCLATVPRSFHLYDLAGNPLVHYGGDDVHFDPGSATLEILDYRAPTSRKPVTADLIRAARLADSLPAYDAVSTCMVPSDVPEAIGDLYRLYLNLHNSGKPNVTGAFAVESWHTMKDLLAVIAGGEDALREKPRAVFDICPSPPLLWSGITVENLIDCALFGVPAELVSMPLTGATAPVTIIGAVVQHAAESLSGIVIHQIARPGAPIVWGGAPTAFDMRAGATPMGAIETAMIDASYCQVGKSLGLPTHAYLGSSDAKVVDAQAGYESAWGILIAALAGINMVSGAGVLDFETCFSLEKTVIDAEIIDQVRWFMRGVNVREGALALDVMREVGHSGYFLAHPSTRKLYREELRTPTSVTDRDYRRDWEEKGSLDALDHAHQRVEALLAAWQPPALSPEQAAELDRIALTAARAAGMDALPAKELAV